MQPGIVVAMVAEARIIAAGPFTAGKLYRLRDGSLMVLSGIGAARAARSAKALVAGGADALVSWGFAGGIAPGVHPGTLLLPRVILSVEGNAFHAAAGCHERIRIKLGKRFGLHCGSLAESRTVVTTAGNRDSLYLQTGAAGTDMESAAIAAVASEAGIPFLAIRAVTDTRESGIPQIALQSLDAFGCVKLPVFLRQLLRRPWDIGALIRAGRNFRKARKSLREVALIPGGIASVFQDEDPQRR
jgi:adenosylhomocysteine nucleosidase